MPGDGNGVLWIFAEIETGSGGQHVLSFGDGEFYKKCSPTFRNT